MMQKKKKLYFIIFFAILCIICCCSSGCINKETPQIAYAIGEEHTFGMIKVKVEHDELQEKFIIHFNISEQNKDNRHWFHFTFNYDSNSLRNSEQFEYFDETDTKIEFNESGYYVFQTSKTFYVSYKNANTDVKAAIIDRKCNFDFGQGTFYFYSYSDKWVYK